MSKKINNTAINATVNNEVNAETKNEEVTTMKTTTVSLKDYFEKYPNVSIRKLAAVTNINYGILLKKSKEPVAGQAYDPEAINWSAVEDKLISKKIDWTTLDWDVLNEGPSRKGATLVKDMDAFKVGDKVWLRRDNVTPYEIVYKTETHVVLMQEGTSEPVAWSNNTFLINGPVFQPRAEKVVTAE